MGIRLAHITSKLPATDATQYRKQNQKLFLELNHTCIIIDDDPTGNQTVYDIPLLTEWDDTTIADEFYNETPVFFILTNSRSLAANEVARIFQEITENILKAAALTKRRFTIISRSDSTLRGHFPLETDTIRTYGNYKDAITVFIPVMFEGGRITVDDIHYIADETELTPVSKTPFAQDHTFGYTSSNLKNWIEEKTKGIFSASDIQSISIPAIRTESTESLCARIQDLKHTSYCIINALNYQDLDKIANALLLAQQSGKQIVYRTSSSFIPSYLGLSPKDTLDPQTLLDADSKNGGLIIVGSYVSKSSIQLNYALTHWNPVNSIEIDIEKLLEENKHAYLSSLISGIDQKLSSGEDVIVYTSRELVTGENEDDTIDIAAKISYAITSIIRKINSKPRYIIAKGGITSHDIATKGLCMKRSKVLGQIVPGIPVWEMGTETRFPKLPFIVFPGNVGHEKTLYDLTQKLTI